MKYLQSKIVCESKVWMDKSVSIDSSLFFIIIILNSVNPEHCGFPPELLTCYSALTSYSALIVACNLNTPACSLNLFRGGGFDVVL